MLSVIFALSTNATIVWCVGLVLAACVIISIFGNKPKPPAV